MTKWAYGVSTTPARLDDLLPQSLASLERAGFPEPRLFVDGCDRPEVYRHLCLPMTCREPSRDGKALGNFGNWWGGMMELYCRNPDADFYVMFEDDILCCRNLREFLEQAALPCGYWNLYTCPQNERLISRMGNPRGWFPSNQHGYGALGLMFNREQVEHLLSSRIMAKHPQTSRGYKRIDGKIIEEMKLHGIPEYCHFPSMMQHTGINTTIPGQPRHKPSASFPGEGFDALELLEVGCHS